MLNDIHNCLLHQLVVQDQFNQIYSLRCGTNTHFMYTNTLMLLGKETQPNWLTITHLHYFAMTSLAKQHSCHNHFNIRNSLIKIILYYYICVI